MGAGQRLLIERRSVVACACWIERVVVADDAIDDGSYVFRSPDDIAPHGKS